MGAWVNREAKDVILNWVAEVAKSFARVGAKSEYDAIIHVWSQLDGKLNSIIAPDTVPGSPPKGV